jgi:site-specific recombinase XerD
MLSVKEFQEVIMLTDVAPGWQDSPMAAKEPRRGATALQRSTIEGWLNTQPSPNTRAAYRSDLYVFGRWCAHQGAIPLAADTSTLIAFQLARETAGDSDSTIRRRWSALSSFYEYAVDHRLAPSNPAVGVDRPKVLTGDPSPTIQLSPEAVAGYRASAAALDPRLDALVALLVSDGLKVGEALALDIDDMSRNSRGTTIILHRRGESRRIVLDPGSAKAVRRCVGTRRAGPVFVSERSTTSELPSRLTRFGADHLIRQLVTDNKAERVTANALRRFHISTHESGTTALDTIRDRAGLADIRGVRRYLPVSEQEDPSGVATGKNRVSPRRSRGTTVERSK